MATTGQPVTPPAPSTRRTLIFPAVDIQRPRWHAPPDPSLRRPPPQRPSERPTVPSLPPTAEVHARPSFTEVIELSASALQSVPGTDDSSAHASAASSRARIALAEVAAAIASSPRALMGVVLARSVAGNAALGAFAVALLASVASGDSPGRIVAAVREPRVASVERTPLAPRTPEPTTAPASGMCAAAGPSRVLASSAHLAPGLDVNVLERGFGVGFASSAGEALGVKLDGAMLRVADRVRVRAGGAVKHVAVDVVGSEDEIDLRVDADDGRTVVPDGDAAPFRIAVVGAWIQVARAEDGKRTPLWPVPGAFTSTNPNANANAKGFVSLGPAKGKGSPRVVVPPTDVRAAARDEGGAVVSLRRPSALWLGWVDAHLGAEGPLVPVPRQGAALGMPSVASWEGRGAVAWAEKPAGGREWTVVVASFASPESVPESAEDAHERLTLREIGAGMSPSIAALPDGDLLLAYAVGTPGSHRVVVRRLGRDLSPRGEAIAVSPDEVNAGQPAAAVAADGRGLVAFFGAERGRAATVLATPLSCDTRL